MESYPEWDFMWVPHCEPLQRLCCQVNHGFEHEQEPTNLQCVLMPHNKQVQSTNPLMIQFRHNLQCVLMPHNNQVQSTNALMIQFKHTGHDDLGKTWLDQRSNLNI